MIDRELIELSAYPLPDVIAGYFQLVGFAAAGFAVAIFTVWGAWHTVRFMRQILKS